MHEKTQSRPRCTPLTMLRAANLSSATRPASCPRAASPQSAILHPCARHNYPLPYPLVRVFAFNSLHPKMDAFTTKMHPPDHAARSKPVERDQNPKHLFCGCFCRAHVHNLSQKYRLVKLTRSFYRWRRSMKWPIGGMLRVDNLLVWSRSTGLLRAAWSGGCI